MPRADRPITIVTGMIIAALYVILLVGFAQESYTRRDAASRLNGAGGWTALYDLSKRLCRIEPLVCAESPPNRSEPGQELAKNSGRKRGSLTMPESPLSWGIVQ